ncbi:MAG: hypothetical protein OEV76_02895 [Anaerolineae bacterium]|nr:hypothetical protein [Anaerolineae bacterium]
MTRYDESPARIVLLNLLELVVALALGLVLAAQVDWWAVPAFVVLGCLELVLPLAYGRSKGHYYRRLCGLGLGKMGSFVFRQRDQSESGKALSQTVAWALMGLTIALLLAAGLVSIKAGSGPLGLAPWGAFLVLVLVIASTHSRYVCGRCQQARDGVGTLGGLAGRS